MRPWFGPITSSVPLDTLLVPETAIVMLNALSLATQTSCPLICPACMMMLVTLAVGATLATPIEFVVMVPEEAITAALVLTPVHHAPLFLSTPAARHWILVSAACQ